MKYLSLLTLFFLSFVSIGQITPLPEDTTSLEYPYKITEIYIGHKNCHMMYIMQGKKGFPDVLYYIKTYNSSLVKIPLPQNLAKKKRVVFLFKSKTGVAFGSRKSSKNWYTFYPKTMTWLSKPKKGGHDGEDDI
jgi:hypothetical protein